MTAMSGCTISVMPLTESEVLKRESSFSNKISATADGTTVAAIAINMPGQPET